MPADSRDMVLVPDTPTEAMMRAWNDAIPASAKRTEDGAWEDTPSAWFRARWRAALSASPARGEGDAPVAWRGRDLDAFGDGAWAVCSFKPSCDVVEPLYTHPAPATPAGDELRTALELITALRATLHAYMGSGDETVVALKKNAYGWLLAETDTFLAALQPQAEGEDQ